MREFQIDGLLWARWVSASMRLVREAGMVRSPTFTSLCGEVRGTWICTVERRVSAYMDIKRGSDSRGCRLKRLDSESGKA